MNVITKSGNLAPYLRATTQVVANSVKTSAPASVAAELSVPKSFDVAKTNSNNSPAAQTSIVGGKFANINIIEVRNKIISSVVVEFTSFSLALKSDFMRLRNQ